MKSLKVESRWHWVAPQPKRKKCLTAAGSKILLISVTQCVACDYASPGGCCFHYGCRHSRKSSIMCPPRGADTAPVVKKERRKKTESKHRARCKTGRCQPCSRGFIEHPPTFPSADGDARNYQGLRTSVKVSVIASHPPTVCRPL